MPGPIDYSLINVKPDPDTKEWWDGTKENRLLVRLCNDCGHKFFPPFPACPGLHFHGPGLASSGG